MTSPGDQQKGSAAPASTGSTVTRVLGVISLVGMALVIPLGLLWTPADGVQGDAVRLLYVHVPSAWLMYLSVISVVVGGAMYLWKGSQFWDLVGEAGAEVGVLFCSTTLISGMLWGRPTWGAYWVWDARLTSTALLLVLLVGCVALRRATTESQGGRRRSAWLGLSLLPNAIIIHFAVDWWRSLHQTATVRPTGAEIEGLMLFTWMLAGVIFMVIWVWMMIHRFRIAFLTEQLDVHGRSVALEARRAEAVSAPVPPAPSGGLAPPAPSGGLAPPAPSGGLAPPAPTGPGEHDG